MAREAIDVCLRVLKESNKSRFERYSVKNKCIDHIPYYFRDCRLHSFCDNLSRNSCILIDIFNKLTGKQCPSSLSIAIQLEHFGMKTRNIQLIRISLPSTETYLQLNEIFICFPQRHFAPIRVQNCDFICLIGGKM